MSYSYYPKRPIKSFQDLEVYQKVLGICVAVVKRIAIETPLNGLVNKLHQCVLSLPVLIATAHSVRFSNQSEAVAKLEEAMLNCNLAVVYLEQFRDLGNKEIEIEFFEEQIKNLLAVRMKIMHLQRSWKRFFESKNHV